MEQPPFGFIGWPEDNPWRETPEGANTIVDTQCTGIFMIPEEPLPIWVSPPQTYRLEKGRFWPKLLCRLVGHKYQHVPGWLWQFECSRCGFNHPTLK